MRYLRLKFIQHHSLLVKTNTLLQTMSAPTGSAAVDAELTAKLEEQAIQQEYKIWKKNTVSY